MSGSAAEDHFKLRKEALLHFASIDLTEWCQEAKVEHCRAVTGLTTCGDYVKHSLSSCGHASLCEECSHRCEVCPICRTPLPKNGKLRLRLYDKCIEAGIISNKDELRPEQDYQREHLDVQRLYSLFDVALENNLVSSICHYVTDVCLDENAVSSDPVVAFLLDEVVVKNWCRLKYKSVVESLRSIYARADSMQANINLLRRISSALNGLNRILSVLESSLAGSLSAELQDLHWLLENISKAKQHSEIMIWCLRHHFLENIPSRYFYSISWKMDTRDRKMAAQDRTWPNSSMLKSTLFIEDALSNLQIEREFAGDELDVRNLTNDLLLLSESSEMVGESGIYPFKDLRSATDILFLHGSSDMAVAKRAIFLYYLFDRHWSIADDGWRQIVDDFADSFGIPKLLVTESLVFYLLDDHSDEALHQASKLLPEIASLDMHPKVAEVLLERQKPDLALTVLRCCGRGEFSSESLPKHEDDSHVVSIGVAITAVRVRIECGLLTEAFIYQRMHCSSVATNKLRVGSSEEETNDVEMLVTEICSLCIRRNLVDRMIELPWDSVEELFLHKCLFDKACQEPSSVVGSLLVVYYLQRCRYVEAFRVDKKLGRIEQSYFQNTSEEELSKMKAISQWREELISKSVDLLPEIQRVELKSGKSEEIRPSRASDFELIKENPDSSYSPTRPPVLHPDHKRDSTMTSNAMEQYSSYPLNGKRPYSNGFSGEIHHRPTVDLSTPKLLDSPVTPFESKLTRSIVPRSRFKGEHAVGATEKSKFSLSRGIVQADAISATSRRGYEPDLLKSSEDNKKKDALFRFEEREIPKAMTIDGIQRWRSDDSSEDDDVSQSFIGSRLSSLKGRGRRARR